VSVPERDTIPATTRNVSTTPRRGTVWRRTDRARVVDVARHDANLALPGLDDAGAVGADKARLALAHKRVLDADLVQGGADG
jgi:hypothetical protein